MNDYSPLFRPLKLRTLTLANRIVVPPMMTHRNIVGDDGIQWYTRLAQGGAALIIIEATKVSDFGSTLTVSRLRRLVDAVHAQGVPVIMQLFPGGVWPGKDIFPHELTIEQIHELVESFQAAAGFCVEAGFDGVEPHGAHDYILNKFFSPLKNQRGDRYGGKAANRMRLGREIVRAIRKEVGDAILVLYRHSPRELGSYVVEDSIPFAKALVEDGVEIMDLSRASDKEPADLAAPVKAALRCPVIACNDMDDPERALFALQEGRADLIAVGRGLIADPEWPRKVKEGRLSEIVECLKCDEGCFGNLWNNVTVSCVQRVD
jgi:2,4-dienoyl-CoA reductase-like NADH-dependent reductase (Old Yellow Enzyme family)